MRFVQYVCAITVTLAVATSILVAIYSSPLSSAVLREPDRRWILDKLPAAELAFVKMAYANEDQRADVGLFGNSRIVMVGNDTLRLPGIRLFNFGVPGQSIRQSVRLIQELRSIDKLPSTIVISMDHVELGMPGGDGVYPSVLRRWSLVARDAWELSRSIGWRATAVQIVNAVSSEQQMAAVAFNPSYVASKLKALTAIKGANGAYRADGSRDEGERTQQSANLVIPQRAYTYPQLEYDFETLGALRRNGIRVIVFESPLAPSIVARIEQGLSARARNVRDRFHTACNRVQIECLAPPLLAGPGWVDRDHAPAALLGAWLQKILQMRG